MQTNASPSPDTADLEQKVKNMYREVALHPHEKYHFEMGRLLAEKLGYDPKQLDQVPSEAIESFAGVGYFFDYAAIKEGDKVLDLGSGSGMDSFLASIKAGSTGQVTGVDMTDEQLKKSEALRIQYGFRNVSFHKGHIENLPFQGSSFDIVISNGVINLCADKHKVFKEVARVLKPGGRIAIADIVSEKSLPDNIVCDATLWASCIGGATQQDEYSEAIINAGLDIMVVEPNTNYTFISASSQSATKKYGIKSVTIMAGKKIMADAMLRAPGLACATLTPAIQKDMLSLSPGMILEVISDDAASREGVPAWCRLTGNKLLSEAHESEEKNIFYIQKKNS